MSRHLYVISGFCVLLIASPFARGGHNGGGHRGSRSASMSFPGPLRPVPITRPVDLVWPPVIIGPMEYTPAVATYQGETEPEPSAPSGRGVEVRLDDCMENSARAGYNFASHSIVSCEDSTVDIYLSFDKDGTYYFLVPEDTQIKDIGQANTLRSIRLIKPGGWYENHAAELLAGHVYVVWASTGDLYLVKIDVMWEKHVMFSWLWHSRLSREAAERFLNGNAGGPPGTPYFSR
jgi:hypothetical protein